MIGNFKFRRFVVIKNFVINNLILKNLTLRLHLFFFSMLFLLNLQAQILVNSPAELPVPNFQDYLKSKTSKIKRKVFISDSQSTSTTPSLNSYSLNDVKKLAQELDLQFRRSLEPLKGQVPGCASEAALSYIQALNVAGQFDACSNFANQCLYANSAQNEIAVDPKIATIAALCESTRYHNTAAKDFFQRGAELTWTDSSEWREHLFNWAIFLLNNGYEEKIDDVFRMDSSVIESERKLMKGIVQRLARSSIGDLKKIEIDAFLASLIQKSSGDFQKFLQAIEIRIKLSDYNYNEAVNLLFKQGPKLQNPLLWYDLAYDVVYYGLDENFRWAREIYSVSDKYSNPWRNFPSESNTYNYSEIYSDICKANLLQNSGLDELEEIKLKLRQGSLTTDRALLEVTALDSKYPHKADVLTAKANLLAIQGDQASAMNTYWEAHRLCRYFNRANWGLTLSKRFFKYQQMPDYTSNLQRITERLKTTEPAEELKSYILNWSSLDEESQRRVTYGSWIWQPYISLLKQNEMRTYIKYAFDLLSETPGLSEIRDQRIGGANYPHDNRLWDDVRGIGGTNVVADLAEVYQTVQGDYNLLGHEIAHQFHQMLESIYPTGAQCIEAQFQQALRDKNFPDGYSAYNKEEHFAQGVTYYLVPKDSSARFGLNQSWVMSNNPKQFEFIESIVNSNGQLKKIACPKN